MRDNLQDQFKKLLQDAEVKPPAGTWSRIERELPAPRSFNRILPVALSLVSFLVASLGLFLLIDHDQGTLQPLLSSKPIPPGDRQRSTIFQPASKQKALKNPEHTNPTTTIVFTNKNQVQTAGIAASVQDMNSAKRLFAHTDRSNSGGSAGKTTEQGSGTNMVPVQDQKRSIHSPEGIADANRSVSAQVLNAYPDEYNSPIIPGGPLPLPADALLASIDGLPAPAFGPTKRVKDPELYDRHQQKLEQFRTYDAVRGFHLGAFVGINSTWMSRKTDLVEHEGNIIDPKTHVGLTFGLVAGYDFREKWGFQFEPAIRNAKGQHFSETCLQTGEITEKKLTLRYYRFPLLMKYKIALIGGPERRPMVIGFVAGPMFNILNQKTYYEGTESVYISPEFVNHMEFGAMSGFDLDLYLSKNLYFTAATRVSFSSGVERQKPVSVQLGFTAQFHFRFPPKENKPATKKQ